MTKSINYLTHHHYLQTTSIPPVIARIDNHLSPIRIRYVVRIPYGFANLSTALGMQTIGYAHLDFAANGVN